MLAVRQETELLFSIYDAKKGEVVRQAKNTTYTNIMNLVECNPDPYYLTAPAYINDIVLYVHKLCDFQFYK